VTSRLLTRRVVVGAALLPMVFGLLVLWSLEDRAERTDQVPAAVVNLDEPVTQGSGKDKQVVAAGRLLAAGLTSPREPREDTLGWQLTNQADAEQGLRDGAYYAVVTIPEDFSATLSSVSEDDPRRAELSVRSNDASSALVTRLSRQVADVAAARLGQRVTQTYLEGVFSRTDELRLRLGKAADAAGRVADGAGQVADGARQVDGGADALAGGLGRLADGAGRLGGGADRLAEGGARLAAGSRRLADGAARLDRGAGRLAGGLGTLERRTDPLPRQTDRLADGAGRVADGTAAYADLLVAWKDACTSSVVVAARPDLCARTARATGVRGETARQLEQGARQVAAGARRLADATPTLTRALDRAATGASRLSEGSGRVAGGTDRLTSGATRLADGLGRLGDGAGQLAGGAQQARTGADRLADGSARLASGSARLGDGSRRLATGLSDGAEQIPGTDDSAAGVVADPVTTRAAALNPAEDGASLLAPVVLALGLWLGAFATYLVRRALPASVLGAARPAWRHTWAGWFPAVVVGAVQGVLLLLATLAFGASYGSPVGVAATVLVAAAAFTALNQAFVAVLGARRGAITAIAFTALQAVALGGLLPVDTAPGPVQLLHAVLPVPQAADAFAGLTLGGQVGSPLADAVVVALWGLAALAVTTGVVRRRQRLTPGQVRRTVTQATSARTR
jgi:putative membrane protein